ncbi:hypothetical protein EZV76_16530 [Flagellimonas alvinocaridis]|uniref:Uncharacterized protein n=1 Tax=Flagellimonas alvinocaridis TaxID=2530200 RepID=A0A4S8RF42_9FLAO|nr:hypothetical protein [Allomuricauda alvinocaridis]THV56837.1 hypothetical protein EZV76_16530 [Allomuricauda alvinocaridis]
MGKKIFTLKNVAIGIGLIMLDLAVYIVLGLLLMDYDDFYDKSKGEYWSLESMTASQKATYIGLNIWHILNIIIIGYLIYRIIKIVRNNVLQQRV